MKFRSLVRTAVQVGELCPGCITFGVAGESSDSYSILGPRTVEQFEGNLYALEVVSLKQS